MDLTEAIMTRTSVRTFSNRPLTEADRESLHQAIAGTESPFGGDVTIALANFPENGQFKPSTYGVITGATDYLMMWLGNDDASWISGGYRMEQVVLRATQLGIGSCWIAATFKGSVFACRMDAPSGQALKVVSPVGYAADRRRWLERVTRAVARSSSRKDFDRLFAYGEPGKPIDAGSNWYAPLMLMRQAPSSTNSQPWRAVVTTTGVDFYHIGKSRLALIDMGIGLCHFHIGCEAAEIPGNFVCEPETAGTFSGLTYLCSFRSGV